MFLIHGRFARVKDPISLSIETGSQGQNRNDLVVCEYSYSGNETEIDDMELVVVTGTPANPGSETDPSIEDDLTLFDIEYGGSITDETIIQVPLWRVPKEGLTTQDPVALFKDYVDATTARSSIAPNVLWQGALHMSGSQQANLSSNLNEQMIGIYLCWKEYTDGVATENRTYQFIPKGVPSGCAFDQFLTNRGAGLIGNKQVYVYDDRIVGDDNNSRGEYTASTTNLRMSNNRWVLAEIIGI